MKLLTLLVLFCLSATLYGCPKKKAEGESAEPVEGASTADKSGEGSSDEMQEKKGASSAEAPPAEAPASGAPDEKK